MTVEYLARLLFDTLKLDSRLQEVSWEELTSVEQDLYRVLVRAIMAEKDGARTPQADSC